MTRKEKILLSLVLFFFATLFFPWVNVLNIIAASLLAIYAFTINTWKEKWLLLKERKYLQVMLLFFIVIVISVILSSNVHKALRYLDPRLPLAYFPLSIGLLHLNTNVKHKILVGFAWLTTIAMVVVLTYGIYRSGLFQRPEFLYNDSLTEILQQQSIYIALLVNFAIYIFSYHLLYKKSSNKIWMLAAIIFLFGMSYLLASRNQMVTLYLFALIFAIYYILRQKKYLAGIALLTGLFVIVFLIFRLFPKTINRYRELAYTQFDYRHVGQESHYNMAVTKDQWNGANFRLAAWECGWELFMDHPFKGVDIGDKKDALMQKYREKKFQFGLQTQKNVHNNYLDILYSMGLIGLVVFLAGWIILPLLYARRYNDGLSIVIIITFAVAWITEIYFDRSLGGMLTGFFIPFLLTNNRENAH